MRKIIIAITAIVIATSAFAKGKVDEFGNPVKRNATTIKACGAKWKEAKADPEVKAKGWPAYWSACAKEAKAAKTLAP